MSPVRSLGSLTMIAGMSGSLGAAAQHQMKTVEGSEPQRRDHQVRTVGRRLTDRVRERIHPRHAVAGVSEHTVGNGGRRPVGLDEQNSERHQSLGVSGVRPVAVAGTLVTEDSAISLPFGIMAEAIRVPSAAM